MAKNIRESAPRIKYLRLGKTVANTKDRFDIGGVTGVFFYFRAQIFDMCVNGAFIPLIGNTLCSLKKLHPAEHSAGVGSEGFEKVEFGRG